MKDFARPLLALLAVAVIAGVAHGATLYVPQQYPTIQAAVDAAGAGDEIVVAPGTYYDCTHVAGAGDTTRCSVVMKSDLKLRGSGMGLTVIDADSSGRGIHLYQCSNVEISEMTITGGYAELYGGAIFCRQSSPHIVNVEAEENWDGGFAMIENSAPTIEHCSLHNNVAKAGGGLEIEITCDPYVYDCDIVDNNAPFAAGVMVRGTVTLDHCRITNNLTTGGETELGGGILADDGATLNIVGCDIIGNQSAGGGGGIAFKGDGTGGLVERCRIMGNSCTGLEGRGGGIYILDQAIPEIRNTIVALNFASGAWSDGGGMFIHLSGIDMTNCTFYSNWTQSETGEGGGIGVQTSMFIPIPVSITHTIISNSLFGKGVSWIGTSNPPVISCCDIFGNAGGDEPAGTGADNFSLDPLLCDPIGMMNFHIEDGSPCAPGNHPEGPTACGGLLIGAMSPGCDSGIDEPDLARATHLLGNRPNPFRGSTVISFVLDHERPITLDVLDASGRRVALLYEGSLAAGLQEITWNGRTLQGGRAASGVYFYRLRCAGLTEGLRMLRLD